MFSLCLNGTITCRFEPYSRTGSELHTVADQQHGETTIQYSFVLNTFMAHAYPNVRPTSTMSPATLYLKALKLQAASYLNVFI